jgi:carbonic anhydrase
MDCEEALLRLKAGNERFVLGQPIHPHEAPAWRRQLLHGCRPLATILGCSDPTAPPELVFDQGLGDLFVIRVAGNLVAPDVLGSLEFAAVHLDSRLFVVLGHECCATVRAALAERAGLSCQPGRIESVMRLILPALKDIKLTGSIENHLAAAVEANVRWSVQQLSELPEAKKSLLHGRVKIVGAIYKGEKGQVRFLE